MVFSTNSSNILFKKYCTATFARNHAIRSGGCVYSEFCSTKSFNETSLVTFTNNIAMYGGRVLAIHYGYISMAGNSKMTFTLNNSSFGEGYMLHYTQIYHFPNTQLLYHIVR